MLSLSPGQRSGTAVRWRLGRAVPVALLPALLGMLFFAASLTPSLIPRSWQVQGALGGLVAGLGYMLGVAALSLWRAMQLPLLRGRAAELAHAALVVPVIALVVVCLWQASAWQNSIRSRMGMELADTAYPLRTVLLAVLVFSVLLVLGAGVRLTFDRLRRWLYRHMPPRTANVASLILTALLLLTVTRDGVLDRVITGLDASYTAAQALFDADLPPPEDPRLPGSTASLIDWGAMGQPGRDFVLGGPHRAEIAALTGRPALDPIRVYVGLAEAEAGPEGARARAELALAELIRLDAFSRSVLIVAMPSGTGWLDPGSFDVVEYLHGGDIASVAVQYSYLQSPMALVLETRAGLDQARALVSVIHEYWRGLPRDARPRLYMHGLSLGAWASMYGTDLFALLDDPIDGALWVGPPFPSALWNQAMSERNPGSPWVAPEIGNGRLIRFASHGRGAGGPGGWGSMRLMFLQYSSDPIVFYEPSSVVRPPVWMREPPAADVSPALRFMPVVTQFQLVVDMVLANTAPPGHGHNYAATDMIDPWIAVTDPPHWSEADTARLRALCSLPRGKGCGPDHGARADAPASPVTGAAEGQDLRPAPLRL